MESDEENEDSEDDLSVISLQYPTSKTSSFISRKKDGELYSLKLEDGWKEYQMKLQLWRSKDLKDSKDWKDKANRVHKTMILNFDGTNKIMLTLGDLEATIKKQLQDGGARWQANRYNEWRK
jgi:hypothetical protein